MADTGEATAALKTFPMFSRLANELQFAIWRFAVDDLDARVIQLVVKRADEVLTKTLAPSLLHICRTSRKIALEKYNALTLGGNFNGTHIRWDKDTIFFQGDLKAVPSRDYHLLNGIKFDQLFDECTNLAMSFRNASEAGENVWCSPSLPGPNELHPVEVFLRKFKNLHTLWVHDNFKNKVAADTRGDGNLSFRPSPCREPWNGVGLQRLVASTNLSIKTTCYGYFVRGKQTRLRRKDKTPKLMKRGAAEPAQTVTKGFNNGHVEGITGEIASLSGVGDCDLSQQLMKHSTTKTTQTVTKGVDNGTYPEGIGGVIATPSIFGDGCPSQQLMEHNTTETTQTVTNGVGNVPHAEVVGDAIGGLHDAGDGDDDDLYL